MDALGKTDIFFAYAGYPNLRAETMREAANALKRSGLNVKTWQDIEISGRLLINTICEEIERSQWVVAEISSLNSNVLFELGFAISKGKIVVLAFDETDSVAQKNWAKLSLLGTVGRIDYGGSAEALSSRVVSAWFENQRTPLLSDVLVEAQPREVRAIFAPSVPTKTTAVQMLEKSLSRKRDVKFLATGDDLGLATLQYYCGQIYRSSASLLHLLSPSRGTAFEHNARASLLAGFACGLELSVLIVAEEGFVSPLDYKDMLFVYSSTADLITRVDSWIATLPVKSAPGARRTGRFELQVELPIRSFGQYVTENEIESLSQYFIETREFESILNAEAQVFVGRKGTGKTAAMTQVVRELKKDKRTMVVPIKPSSYELTTLVDLINRMSSSSNRQYLLHNLWYYLLVTEMACKTISFAEDVSAGTGGSGHLADLNRQLAALGLSPEDDFASRLDLAVATLGTATHSEADAQAEKKLIEQSLRSDMVMAIEKTLCMILHDFDRVAILIDNLDKTWESGVAYVPTSQFLLALLSTSGKVKKSLAKHSKGAPSVNLTLGIFIRTDIFDVLTRQAREPDKINPQSIQWNDDELLIRVLEERFQANKSGGSQSDMWSELFCEEVHGLPVRDFVLWRTLARPRDVIFYANSALTRAINRKHDQISESDLIFAEKEYSKFAVEALSVESQAQGFDFLEILFEFAGLSATISLADLDGLLSAHGDAEEIRLWLLRTSFLGVEVNPEEFVHIEGEEQVRRKLKVAQRLAKNRREPERYRIHPAFRPYLEVRDDDLHGSEVKDITLSADDDAAE